ncbi:MAG TPA: disulfide bond formation protein B [Nitrosomonas nitrosa]|uniref:Disulfide bond formation protein B n=1 Tax=Nitrosomonas nitrosa TaxID=52442 RepID=A0A1I4MJ04_9PROT|nr:MULTISPECIES: disulfide bond formation protein B [Nitrosomonas]MCW5599549.1 disulfide bond formation protein B [Nitrosomonas sp.]MCW5602179.1 disulfide bond formation protein B [Nitrosomonas sp.]SFM03033.1 Thiol:disulfide interchange protein DsbB [Nitrosomonas nitrosa]HBZ29829.1 disulfide bond formation protein B [Nitrosomonas nitrosa]HNP51470.1 disulfide bond formation protein B [Nitrosomonas nitrosa]
MRTIFLLIFLSCASLIGYALYLQEIKGLLPCPLCVAQRMAYWGVGLTALLAFLHNPKKIGYRLYGGFMLIFALLGTLIAGRHAWLIRYPESFECGISPEEAFLNALPIAEWWPAMFEANGDCADVSWQFLSLTIPDWSLIAFLILFLLAAYVVMKNYKL